MKKRKEKLTGEPSPEPKENEPPDNSGTGIEEYVNDQPEFQPGEREEKKEEEEEKKENDEK